MKKTKTLLTTLLLLIVATINAQVKSELYVHISLPVYEEEDDVIYCDRTEVIQTITKKKIVMLSKPINLDLKVTKKNIGEAKSWLGESKNGTLYLISSVSNGNDVGILIEPVDKNMNVLDYLPTVLFTKENTCN